MTEQGVTRRLPEIARDVAALANATVAVAERSGRDDLGRTITSVARRWAEPDVTVVVAGAVGSGKSSLLAALAGAPGLLPTGPSVTTSVVTAVRAAAEPTAAEPTAAIWLDGAAEPTPLDLTHWDELSRWIVRDGDRPDGVARVDVAVPGSPLPPRLVLVDTPGVGGSLNPADNLVLAMLAGADALLFVTDGSSPISKWELDLLQRARLQVGICLTAVTRADRYRGAMRIADDTDALLRNRFGAWPHRPSVVSSTLADRAAPGVPEELRAALLEESGIPDLRDRLAEVADHAKHTRLVGLTQLISQVLYALEQDAYQQQLTAMTPPEELAAEKSAIEGQQSRLRENARLAQLGLTDDLARLREDLGIALRTSVATLLATSEQRLQQPKAPSGAALDALEQDLRAASLRHGDEVEQAVAALGARLAIRLDGSEPEDTFDQAEPGEWSRRPVAPGAATDRALRLRFVASLASAGGGLALMAATIFSDGLFMLVRGGAMGASLLIGAVVANSGVRSARRQRELADARTEARSLVDAWQAQIASRTRLRLAAVQRELETALRTSAQGRLAELEARQAEVGALIRADADSRAAAGVAAGRRRQELTELRSRATTLTRELSTAGVTR